MKPVESIGSGDIFDDGDPARVRTNYDVVCKRFLSIGLSYLAILPDILRDASGHYGLSDWICASRITMCNIKLQNCRLTFVASRKPKGCKGPDDAEHVLGQYGSDFPKLWVRPMKGNPRARGCDYLLFLCTGKLTENRLRYG